MGRCSGHPPGTTIDAPARAEVRLFLVFSHRGGIDWTSVSDRPAGDHVERHRMKVETATKLDRQSVKRLLGLTAALVFGFVCLRVLPLWLWALAHEYVPRWLS